jgi:3-oxoacyl-[acyl-carrier-protein] synthase III
MSEAAPRGHPWQSSHAMAVLGTGMVLPGPSIPTSELIALMKDRFAFGRAREAEALAKRMQIKSRHLCRDFNDFHEAARAGTSNADLAAGAIMAALKDAGISVHDIGYMIGHTTTPGQPLPPGIAMVADRIGYHGPYLELRQACTGFANGLMIAHGLLSGSGQKPVVIVGSETGSLFFDPARMADDPGQIINMIQMGDGAGAIVLGPAAARGDSIEGAWFGAVGVGRVPGIQMHHGRTEFDHDFGSIFAHGSILFDAGARAAAAQGVDLANVTHVIPHQVSGRIGEQAAAHLGLPRDRIFVNADRIGNTGSAAIWIAIAELREQALLAGDTVVALGAEASKFMYGGFCYRHG